LAQSNVAVAEARRLAHSPSLALALGCGTMVLLLLRDNADFGEWVDQMVAIAAEQSFPFWRAYGIVCRGWVKVKNGDLTDGIALLRRGLAVYHATGVKMYIPHHISLLARACDIAGQLEQALTLLDDGLELAETTREHWFLAELNRLKGQLLVTQGCFEAADALYRKALSIAREQEAKLWELRAAVSLSRLRRNQGRHAEARDLLAPIYGWFTEGFDTPDLKEAKALLEELT
jgi:predicted ATPase